MPVPQLSRDEIHRRLDSFRAHWLRELEEWKEQGLTGEEQKAAQRFWIDLFSCFGVSAQRMNLFEASWVWFRFFYGPVLMGWVR